MGKSKGSHASTSSHKPTPAPPKSKPKPAPPPPKETTVVTSAPAPRTWTDTANTAGAVGSAAGSWGLASAKTVGAFAMVGRMNDLTDSLGGLLGDAVGSVGEGVHEMYDDIGGLANRISDGVGDSVGALSDIAPTVITIGVVLGVSVGVYQLYRMYQ